MLNDLDVEIDPPELEELEEDHGSLKRDLRKLELELRDLGREIRTRAYQLQRELKEKFSGVNS
jgi:hypothetical protein